MTEKNKQARKESNNKIKKKKFFKSIETKKEYIIACIVEYIILLCTCIFSSSLLNTLIVTFAFDFVFVKFFYNAIKDSNHKRVKDEIDKYNQKFEKEQKNEIEKKNENTKKAKPSFLCFDEEYFEKRSDITINAFRLFIYCTCVIPVFIYDGFTSKDGGSNLKIDLTQKVYRSISEFFKEQGKELFAFYSLVIGSILFIIILLIYSIIDNVSEEYNKKYEEFKDIRDSFVKEDFLFLKKDEEKNCVKTDDEKSKAKKDENKERSPK